MHYRSKNEFFGNNGEAEKFDVNFLHLLLNYFENKLAIPTYTETLKNILLLITKIHGLNQSVFEAKTGKKNTPKATAQFPESEPEPFCTGNGQFYDVNKYKSVCKNKGILFYHKEKIKKISGIFLSPSNDTQLFEVLRGILIKGSMGIAENFFIANNSKSSKKILQINNHIINSSHKGLI